MTMATITVESLYQYLKELRSESAEMGSREVRIQLGYNAFHRIESRMIINSSDAYGPCVILTPENKITT